MEAAGVPELVTDRPDFTESSVVVPRGAWQLESGFALTRDSGVRSLGAPEMLLRWGIGRRTELRLGLPDFVHTRGSEHGDGFADTYLGFKQQLGAARSGLGLALIPAVSLPTGARRLTSGRVDPEVKLAWSRPLPEPWAISGMGVITV